MVFNPFQIKANGSITWFLNLTKSEVVLKYFWPVTECVLFVEKNFRKFTQICNTHCLIGKQLKSNLDWINLEIS